MMKNYIENMWGSFKFSVLKNCSEEQTHEMRKAFFAGAIALFSIMIEGVSEDAPGPTPTPKDMKMMDSLNQELEDFKRSIADEIVASHLSSQADQA